MTDEIIGSLDSATKFSAAISVSNTISGELFPPISGSIPVPVPVPVPVDGFTVTELLVENVTAQKYGSVTGLSPLAFYTSENSLNECVIYGKAEGVGNLNSTTGKYDIPISLQGKNLIVNKLTTQTYSGITLTRNSDGSVTLNGTATSNINFCLTRNSHTLCPDDYQPIENAVYKISGSPQDSAANKFIMSFRYTSAIGATSSLKHIPATSDVLIDNTNGEYNFIAPYITVWSGVTCDNVTFKPMLRLQEADEEYDAPTAATKRTVSLDASLTEGQRLNVTDVGVTIPTSANKWNTITIGTAIKPELSIMYKE